MNFPFWDLTAASAMFNNNKNNNVHGGPFPANVSSYFRKPSKIVKPSSRTQSPRNNGRRRMTTTAHFPARTRSVVDNLRSTMSLWPEFQQPTSRPISWHPNSMEDTVHMQVPFQPMYHSSMTTPYTTAEVHGLVTPMSYPVMDEPQIYDLITPLEELSANDSIQSIGQDREQDISMTQYWLSQQGLKEPLSNYDNVTGNNYIDMDYHRWFANNQYQMSNIPTAPASPSYLPMPDFGNSLTDSAQPVEPEKDELIGMGLYDSPDDVQSSSLLFGGIPGQVTRKSLKLEDAFEPSLHSEETDDAEDDAEAEDDDDFSNNVTVASDIVEGIEKTVMPPESYSYMMNNNDFAPEQWQMQGQAGYHGGWI